MKKIFTFMLSAAALLVSVPSWAEHMYPDGKKKDFTEYNFPNLGTYSKVNDFGTICLPERIVAVQGITIYDLIRVDVNPLDTNEVARLVVDVHSVCDGGTQLIHEPWPGGRYVDSESEPFCPKGQQTATNPCKQKTYIDWSWDYNPDETVIETWVRHDFRMVAGAAYFYTICGSATEKADRKVWVDTTDVAKAPVCKNGFYGTFEETKLNEPVTVLTLMQLGDSTTQFLEQVTQVTIPANRGYFKGNFECVPWRYDTFSEEYKAHPEKYDELTHNPCTGEVKAPRRLSPHAVAFNIGRNATTGLYQVDFEHPLYLDKKTNKHIVNGQLIIEAADGTKYNAFGQRVK